MDGNDLLRLGFMPGKTVGLALKASKAAKAMNRSHEHIQSDLLQVLNMPENYREDLLYGDIAEALLSERRPKPRAQLEKEAPYKIWGKSGIENGALEQMDRAVRLPVAVRGALMPDAHQGYGLPIGGVLATDNSVIPYAVGVDIACRMRLTVFDISPYALDQKKEKYRKALEANTRFGAGSYWDTPREHEVMHDPLWKEHPIAQKHKDVAWRQLGTSGSGNHFVEFGELLVETEIDSPSGKIPPGKYLALLSHSGSRRLGMEIANFYTQVAMGQHPELPKDFQHLAWLNLDQDLGAAYWDGMTLAGKYASANHAIIHEQVSEALHLPVLGHIENHHNFAWKEFFNGEEVIVHRKGATPAGKDVLGVIPGSMSAPGFVVRGLGNADSIDSASHGAGRRMSRSEAMKKFDWDTVKKKLKEQGVDLLSAGLDESPGAYKDIRQVMADQADLVETLAEFKPKMVKMDSGKGGGWRKRDEGE
jgi:tRNA-splicing ligase RtcB